MRSGTRPHESHLCSGVSLSQVPLILLVVSQRECISIPQHGLTNVETEGKLKLKATQTARRQGKEDQNTHGIGEESSCPGIEGHTERTGSGLVAGVT